MGLNQRGRGRGRGGKGSFANKGRRGGGGGMANQGPMFRPGPPPPGMFGPPMGYPPEPPFRAPFFGGPPAFNFGPPRPGYGKFPRKNFKRKPVQKNNETSVLEIDLSKPWVTEEIKNEEAKKKECLEVWRKSKNDEDWSKYKAQKQVVQNLYDKAKDEYIANHPEQAYLLRATTVKYYCETCDKLFKTDDDLYLHEAEHEVCGREGCEFSAHPKIIAKHKRMQHDSGLYKRIGKLYTEEDIKKWIEERKRRYPSRKVIEEKKALEEEKLKRGEKIKDDESKFNKDFRKNKKSNRTKQSECKTSKTSKNRRAKRKAKNRELGVDLEEEIETERKGIPAFRGIGNSCESDKPVEEGEEKENKEKDDLQISDEEWEIPKQAPNTTEPLINSSLKLLATCYDSDEDEGVVLDEKKTEVDKDSNDGDSGPEEVRTVHSRSSTTLEDSLNNSNASRKRKLNNKNEKQNRKRLREEMSQNKLHRKVTLLEKLLKKEIRHERNVILQCVHYVVRNNFLQKTR